MMTRTSRLTLLLAALGLAACGPDAAGPGDNNRNPVRCGNGVTEGNEECDDGNTTLGDGCNGSCRLEDDIPPTVCGDGRIAATEGCDDGDTMDGDGCSAACSVESGYTCAGEPSQCTEQPTGGGTPDGTCANPFVLTLAPDMDGDLTGSGTGDTTNATSQVGAGPCDGGEDPPGEGNDHVWRFTLADERDVAIFMPGTVSFDGIIRVLSAPCDLATEVPEFTGADGCSDQSFAMGAEILVYTRLPAGTYHILVDGFDADARGTYEVRVLARTTTCGNGTLEAEFCDDGNTMNGDGCNGKCEVETGYTCDTEVEPSVCTMGPPAGTAVPPAAGDLKVNEYLAADGTTADSNCDNSTSSNRDEFIELVNVSNKTLDLTGVGVHDENSYLGTLGPRHVFAPAASGSMTLEPGKAVVVWGGGSPACAGVTNFFTASSGQLGLNDGGDTILVNRGTGAAEVVIVEHSWTTAATVGVSSNLDPDSTGTTYADHPALPNGKRFSPGRRRDDSAF